MTKKSDLDNHANQLNPEHDAYWQSRESFDDDDDHGDDYGSESDEDVFEDYIQRIL